MEILKDIIKLGGVRIDKLALKYKTPLYIYEEDIIRKRYRELFNCFHYKKKQVYYAVKANTNLNILKIILEEGAWADVVSPFELAIAKKAGFDSNKILFTVDNMSLEEMKYAHSEDVLINIGSLSQLELFGKFFSGSKCCIRINPGVEAGHHEKVRTGHKLAKFGILMDKVDEILSLTKKYKIKVIGLHEHTGTGIPAKHMDRFLKSMNNLLKVAEKFYDLEFVDFGGGFPIPYRPNDKRLNLMQFGKKAVSLVQKFNKRAGKEINIRFEPGRYIVGESGYLLTKVNDVKKTPYTCFAATDTGFNHLVRPVMYGSYHRILNASNPKGRNKKYTVVGNVCETGDIFAKDRQIPEIKEGDLLIIKDVGAYGFSMASTYNSRPLSAEVLVNNGNAKLIRRRQTLKDLLKEQQGLY